MQQIIVENSYTTAFAQKFAYENDSYWLPDIGVTGNNKTKVTCDCCHQGFKDEEAFNGHLQYDYVCQSYYGFGDKEDDDDTINGNCCFCGRPIDQCTCVGVDVPGNRPSANMWSVSVGRGGSGSGGTPSGGSSGSTSSNQNSRTITGVTVPAKVVNFLKSLKKGGGKIKITSVKRTVRSQAIAMLNNIKKTGVEAQKKIYGPNGDRICDAYNKKLSDEEIIQKFVSIMNSYADPSVFSHHIGGYDWRCTFDISQSALQNPSALFYEIKSRMSKKDPNYDSNILRVYYENRCIHIEYKIKD